MFKKTVLFSALLAASVFTSQAMAAEVSVSKLRINLENGQTADFLTLHNESETEKEAFEISLQKWTQTDNLAAKTGSEPRDPKTEFAPLDVLTDSDSILVSPKTVVILPKQEKIVRIIVNDNDVAQKDYSYRMIINQLPNREVNAEKNTVNLLFKISLPVFVYSEPIKTIEKMNVSYNFSTENGKNYVTFKNNEKQHIQIQEITVGDKKVSLNHYLLPGISDKAELPAEFKAASLTKDKPLVVSTDKGTWKISK